MMKNLQFKIRTLFLLMFCEKFVVITKKGGDYTIHHNSDEMVRDYMPTIHIITKDGQDAVDEVNRILQNP